METVDVLVTMVKFPVPMETDAVTMETGGIYETVVVLVDILTSNSPWCGLDNYILVLS